MHVRPLNVNGILEVYIHVPIFYDNYTADGTEHIHDTERMQIIARKNYALLLCYGFPTNASSQTNQQVLLYYIDEDSIICKYIILLFNQTMTKHKCDVIYCFHIIPVYVVYKG